MTITEAVVVVVVLALILGLGWTILNKSRCGAASLLDKTQIAQIHKAMLTFARENDGVLPTPGLIDQTTDEVSQQPLQDFSHNHSAPLYSYLIGANLVKPSLLVSPDCLFETSAVRVKGDYDYSAFNPAEGRYWDTTFVMRIDSPKFGANCSYAHLAICGDRRDEKWRNTPDGTTPIIGTRGTRGGASSGVDYDRSPTLKFHMPNNRWVGHVCFSDNHSETIDNFCLQHVRHEDSSGNLVKDNIFAAEFAHPQGNQANDDAFIGVFVGATELSVEDVYDPLE